MITETKQSSCQSVCARNTRSKVLAWLKYYHFNILKFFLSVKIASRACYEDRRFDRRNSPVWNFHIEICTWHLRGRRANRRFRRKQQRNSLDRACVGNWWKGIVWYLLNHFSFPPIFNPVSKLPIIYFLPIRHRDSLFIYFSPINSLTYLKVIRIDTTDSIPREIESS